MSTPSLNDTQRTNTQLHPLTPATITTRLQAHHHTLQTQYHLRRIALFGSVAQGTPTPHSDIDLVVEFEQPIGLKFVELCEYLETCLAVTRNIKDYRNFATLTLNNWFA